MRTSQREPRKGLFLWLYNVGMTQVELSERSLITREEVVTALKALVLMGAKDPLNIDQFEPRGAYTQSLLNRWTEQEKAFALQKGTAEAKLEFSFQRITIPIDAGFTGSQYLLEAVSVLEEIDLPMAKAAGLTEVVEKIQARIDSLKSGNKYN